MSLIPGFPPKSRLRGGAPLAAMLAFMALATSEAHAGTVYYELSRQGKEAEATVNLRGQGNVTSTVDVGGPPVFLRDGDVPSPTDYSTWSRTGPSFTMSRGDANRFSVGLGRVAVTDSGNNYGATFQSVIRYRPTTDAFGVTLKVDPLQLFFSYTGDLEGGTPTIDSLNLAFTSQFYVRWLGQNAFRPLGQSYESSAFITQGNIGNGRLTATETSLIRNAAGNEVERFNDASIFADEGVGAASIVVPAVERKLFFNDVPTDGAGFANLYLVYEMSVTGNIEVRPPTPLQPGGPTPKPLARRPFMFAVAGDPIALDQGDFRPTIEITPIPEPSTVALSLAGLAVVAFASRRRRRAA